MIDPLRKAAGMALDYIRREGWTNSQGKEVFIALSQALAQHVDAVNMSQECVDETAKGRHEPVAWMYELRGRIYFTTADQRPVEAAFPHFNKSTPLYTAPPSIEAAVLAEREACAKLCDHWPYGRDDVWSLGQAIRARGEA